MALNNIFNPLPITISYEKPIEHRFSPYEQNNGTVAGLAGNDFAIIASDTRLSAGYSIYSRNQSRIFKLSSKTAIAISGCWCDTLTFVRVLETRLKMYQYEHNKEMSTPAIAQLVSSLLYYKRFFPYYVNCLVAGIDQDGKARCFGYDPVGHKGEELYESGGSAFSLIIPLLDNQIGFKNMENVKKETLTVEKGTSLLTDVYISAAERDIYTGDGLELLIISKEGFKTILHPLRKD